MPFHAEAAELERFVQEMQQKHHDIAEMIKKSSGHANTLQGGTFQGAAGTAFQSTFEHFLTAANKMNDALMTNADNLKNVGEQYAQIERENLDNLNKVGGTLNMS
ncbi:WXG100 family type VII secretion target [Nocardia sp. NPDC004068]|uniref:WXG100 family type VII secretion target n=1 Tax=Nocardia sp. NPDC004068 TaxID=3364303 RepID=UPI0036BE494C